MITSGNGLSGNNRLLLAALIVAVIFVSGCVQKETVYESKPTPTVTEPTYTAPIPTSSVPEPAEEQTNETTKGLPRWGKTSLNVFVNAAASGSTNGFNEGLVNDFKDAAKMLSTSINNKLTFNFVNDMSKADIEVLWVESLPTNALDAIGHTELKFAIGPSFKVIKTATIELLATKDGREVTDHQSLLLSLHEIGHAVGLDHSASKQSIMYPQLQESISGPSQKDIENLLELYKTDPLSDLSVFNVTALKRVIDRTFVKYYLADVSFSVINNGLTDSGDFSFSIDVGGSKTENTAASLQPGSVFRIKYTNLSSEIDFDKITIIADAQNQITELDESNTETVFIGP